MKTNRLREHLLNLSVSRTEPLNFEEGLCVEIRDTFGPESMAYCMSLTKQWNKHSGDDLFPIPCPFGGVAKSRYLKTENLWQGEYGNLRKKLCGYLANVV